MTIRKKLQKSRDMMLKKYSFTHGYEERNRQRCTDTNDYKEKKEKKGFRHLELIK